MSRTPMFLDLSAKPGPGGVKTADGYVWTGETVDERRLFKTREGAEELKARMEAEDAKYMACHQPKRTIVRRVVGEWEDAQ